jgi:adenylate cyclase
MTFRDLAQSSAVERGLVINLAVMEDSGFFSFWDGDETPLEKFNNANYIKEELFNGEDPDEGISFDMYFQYRSEFITAVGEFLSGDYEKAISNSVNDEATRQFVQRIFSESQTQYSRLVTLRDDVAAKVAGAVCVVGLTATSGTDLGLITFQERYPNVGIYSVIANQILSGEFLDDAPVVVPFLLALLLSLVVAFIVKRLDSSKSILAGIISMISAIAIPLLFFIITRRYIGTVVPFAAVALTFLSLTGLNFFSTIREKSQLRNTFNRYLSPAVIDQIIADPSKLTLGGVKKQMTAIFTDVRSFSTITEALGEENPEKLVDLLNYYLTRMSNVILENRGTIDKYEGDAIIAFFGAPVDMEDHAVMACRSVIQMKKIEEQINKEALQQGLVNDAVITALLEKKIISEDEKERPIFTRIGLNSGTMIVGNMGTPNKMDYTMMGNAVNLAARLEGVNKQYNTGGILISEYTRDLIGDEFVIRSLDQVRVVGVNTPLKLYELLDIRSEAPQRLFDMVKSWEQAMEIYRQKDFEGAEKIFTSIFTENSRDMVAKLYLERCKNYRSGPLPENFPIKNLTEK